MVSHQRFFWNGKAKKERIFDGLGGEWQKRRDRNSTFDLFIFSLFSFYVLSPPLAFPGSATHRFRSCPEFIPHAIWLIENSPAGSARDKKTCGCKYCTGAKTMGHITASTKPKQTSTTTPAKRKSTASADKDDGSDDEIDGLSKSSRANRANRNRVSTAKAPKAKGKPRPSTAGPSKPSTSRPSTSTSTSAAAQASTSASVSTSASTSNVLANSNVNQASAPNNNNNQKGKNVKGRPQTKPDPKLPEPLSFFLPNHPPPESAELNRFPTVIESTGQRAREISHGLDLQSLARIRGNEKVRQNGQTRSGRAFEKSREDPNETEIEADSSFESIGGLDSVDVKVIRNEGFRNEELALLQLETPLVNPNNEEEKITHWPVNIIDRTFLNVSKSSANSAVTDKSKGKSASDPKSDSGFVNPPKDDQAQIDSEDEVADSSDFLKLLQDTHQVPAYMVNLMGTKEQGIVLESSLSPLLSGFEGSGDHSDLKSQYLLSKVKLNQEVNSWIDDANRFENFNILGKGKENQNQNQSTSTTEGDANLFNQRLAALRFSNSTVSRLRSYYSLTDVYSVPTLITQPLITLSIPSLDDEASQSMDLDDPPVLPLNNGRSTKDDKKPILFYQGLNLGFEKVWVGDLVRLDLSTEQVSQVLKAMSREGGLENLFDEKTKTFKSTFTENSKPDLVAPYLLRIKSMFKVEKDGRTMSTEKEGDCKRACVAGELYRIVPSIDFSKLQIQGIKSDSVNLKSLPPISSSDAKAKKWNHYLPQTSALAGAFYLPPIGHINDAFRFEKVSKDDFDVRFPVENIAGRFYPSLSKASDGKKALEIRKKLMDSPKLEFEESFKRDKIRLSLTGLINGGYKPMNVDHKSIDVEKLKPQAIGIALTEARKEVQEMIKNPDSVKKQSTPPTSDSVDVESQEKAGEDDDDVIMMDAPPFRPPVVEAKKKKEPSPPKKLGFSNKPKMDLPSIPRKVKPPPAAPAIGTANSSSSITPSASSTSAAGASTATQRPAVNGTSAARPSGTGVDLGRNVVTGNPSNAQPSAAANFFGQSSSTSSPRKRALEMISNATEEAKASEAKKFKMDTTQTQIPPKPVDPRIGITQAVGSKALSPNPSSNPKASAQAPSTSSSTSLPSKPVQLASNQAPIPRPANGSTLAHALPRRPTASELNSVSTPTNNHGQASTAEKSSSGASKPPVAAFPTSKLTSAPAPSTPSISPSIASASSKSSLSAAMPASLGQRSSTGTPSTPAVAPVTTQPTSTASIPPASSVQPKASASNLSFNSTPQSNPIAAVSAASSSKSATPSNLSELIQSKFIRPVASPSPAPSTSSIAQTPALVAKPSLQQPSIPASASASTSMASPVVPASKPSITQKAAPVQNKTQNQPQPRSAQAQVSITAAQGSGQDQEPPLPPGWTKRTSRSTHETFYYHKATKQVSVTFIL